ncbi:MAG: hypothetical protein Tsb0013_20270 [Phycisphaerales bacterium]
MDAREAYHRRAYRVALLLTGARGEALRILEGIARSIPSPETASDARFDRAVIQASRPTYEGTARRDTGELAQQLGFSEPAAGLWSRAHALPAQEREAWILREVEGMDSVRAARAMDCSRNALEDIHLPGAMRALQREGYADALGEIVRALDTLDTDGALAHIQGVLRAHARRSRLVTLVSVVILLVCFGAMLFVLFDLLAWDEREDRVRSGAAQTFSNPIPGSSAEDAGAGGSGAGGEGDG